jgi:20S proteasome alpha/beta subunit
MTPKPFVVPKKPFPSKIVEARRHTRQHRMTLVSALMGREGVAFFSDTRETLGGYAKKNVDKMTVWEFEDSPFRFAIAGATDDATYLDMLERAITASVLKLDSFSLDEIERTLADALAEFYSKHIWLQTAKAPLMEFLLVFQPLPSGRPEVFHVSGTAVNIPSHTVHYKSIGVGAYMADYLLPLLLDGAQTQAEMAIAAAFVGKQIEDNVDGCGPVERIVLFDRDGHYEELGPEEIVESLNIMQPFLELVRTAFSVATEIADMNAHDLALDELSGDLSDIRESNRAWWNSFRDRRRERAHCRSQYEPKGKSSPVL